MIESEVKTKDGSEPITAHTVEEFAPPLLTFKEIQRNHKVYRYATDYMVLDTETSHINDEDAWIYQWAVKIKNDYIYGRTPSEIIALLEKLAEHYRLSTNKRIILYIHNASYDIQYLKHFLALYDPNINILAIDNHSIIQCDVIGFRILCSYKLSNMSLATLSDSYAEKYIKATGEIDYTKVRYQDTKLTKSDWFYMFSDVASQWDGVRGYIKMMGYNYAFECPITSTGFVRAECRKAAKAAAWRDQFLQSQLTLEQYELCRQAFMGGVTIQSFMYSNKTIRSKRLKHKDFTSSYPARQMLDYMPVGTPMTYGEVKTLEEFNSLLNNYCCVFVVELTNVHIKEGVTAPYIPSSKCIEKEEYFKVNGKIVSAQRLKIALCEVDWMIIKEQYKFDSPRVGYMTIFERGSAPKWLQNEVMNYFKNKCELKGVNDELYGKSKAFLNAIYGMTATQILREIFKMDDEMIISHQPKEDEDARRGKLSKYYKSFNNFMPYQLAIYTTAWARYALYKMIVATGNGDGVSFGDGHNYENFIYCDTDSAFYLETHKNRVYMARLTQECRERAQKAGAYVGNKYLGLPEDEPPIRAFRGLHAKCYAMEELNKKTGKFELKVTIAGIPKKATKWIDGKAITMTNAEELGTIDNLKDGFVFSHCGGTRAIYNERPIETVTINGHKIELASNVIIDNINKEVNDTMWTHEGYDLMNIIYSEIA